MNYKHGLRHSRLYGVWCNMKRRCLNPGHPAYKNYGGRGIRVCEEWIASFDKFHSDMGSPPDGATLERVNNDSGYSKSNCIWADRKTQNRNRRSVRLITINGVTRSMAEWSEMSGIQLKTISMRIAKGWPEADAVITPLVTCRVGVKRGERIYK